MNMPSILMVSTFEMLEVGKRGKTDAEIVEADAAAHLAQRLDHALGIVQVGHSSGFRDFNDQAARD